MRLIRGYNNQPKQPYDCVATIGNFDGVHLGHQVIIRRVIEIAQQEGVSSCVILFEPHPKEFFLQQNAPPRIYSFRQKYHYLKALGVDTLWVLPFNQQLSRMQAQDFIHQILIETMRVVYLVVGDDFRFGYQRQGDFELLKRLGQGVYHLEPTKTIHLNDPQNPQQNLRVSSSRIRQALMDKDFLITEQLLGRRYAIVGRVQYGRQLGRTIGFPTANMTLQRKNIPVDGVYWGQATWQEKTTQCPRRAWAVANCGVRPTVDGHNFKLEVHLLGITTELYGIELDFQFFGFLRHEMKFDGLNALTAQIKQDVATTKKLIKQYESENTKTNSEIRQ